MQETILTPTDVILFSGINLHNNPCNYRTIFNIEYAEFRERLGMDFYDDLKKAIVNYSDSIDYVGGSIVKDTVVKFQGVFYTATKDTTSRPDDISSWATAPKFDSDCSKLYDELFCNFLAEYLALSVLFIQIPFIHSSVHTEGVLQYNGQNYDSKDDKSLIRLQNAINSKKELVFANMDNFIKTLSDNSCFKNYKGLIDNCLCSPKTVKHGNRQGYDFG